MRYWASTAYEKAVIRLSLYNLPEICNRGCEDKQSVEHCTSLLRACELHAAARQERPTLMQAGRDGVGRAMLLQGLLCFVLILLQSEAADESSDQFALPDFSIYHTKYDSDHPNLRQDEPL